MSVPGDGPLEPSSGQSPQWFATTHWSVVATAGDLNSPQSTEALERLCRAYWYPLYAYVRRRGYAEHDAQDLTQEFFARFLAKEYLGQVDRAKGRFRSFLLAAMEHFLANEWDRTNAVKRGGKATFVSWDEAETDQHFRFEPAAGLSAEAVYERQWALTLLEQVFTRLREECVAEGKGRLFDSLRVYLSGEKSQSSYAEAGSLLGMTGGAVQVAVHRLRRRYGSLLRDEIAQTLSQGEDVEEELRHLFEALRD